MTIANHGHMSFRGTGRDLFVELGPFVVLTAATLGLGLPWLVVQANRTLYKRVFLSVASCTYEFRFTPSGRQLAPLVWKSALLTLLTAGLYFPWALDELQAAVLRGTQVLRDGRVVGSCSFSGSLSEIRPILWKGLFLNAVTFGAYGPWLHVQLSRYMSQHARIRADGDVYTTIFLGQPSDFLFAMGGQLLLTIASAGLYGFWAFASMLRWQLQHTRCRLLETSFSASEAEIPAAARVSLAQQ